MIHYFVVAFGAKQESMLSRDRIHGSEVGRAIHIVNEDAQDARCNLSPENTGQAAPRNQSHKR
jgi:hypothetical protein